ncbi:MAG: WG repeat-containing protein [Pelobium sp.]
MKLILIFVFGITSTFTYAQKKQLESDYLISYSIKQDIGDLYGYKHRNGKIAIEAQFTSIYTDTLYSMAIVLKDWQWVGIDRNEKVILIPFIYDNGPDYVQEGLFRFVENEKIGFADLDGNKIIPAQYSFATFFKDGIADYYLGGDRIYENGKTRKQNIADGTLSEGDVHWTWGGNITESGYLNRFGQRFKEVGELKNGRREALTVDGKKLWLNRAGKIIKN